MCDGDVSRVTNDLRGRFLAVFEFSNGMIERGGGLSFLRGSSSIWNPHGPVHAYRPCGTARNALGTHNLHFWRARLNANRGDREIGQRQRLLEHAPKQHRQNGHHEAEALLQRSG